MISDEIFGGTHELLANKSSLAMRLITSDELGLLKEIVPELCRRREDVDAGPTSSSSSSSSSSSIATEFAGIRLPAVQRLSSHADSSGGFGSDNNSSSIPGRSEANEIVSFLRRRHHHRKHRASTLRHYVRMEL